MPSKDFTSSADLLQDRLEQLEAGTPLETCLADLPPEEAELLQLVATLHRVPHPNRAPTIAAAQRARFVMSHHSGKIEVLGVDGQHIYMRYHRAARPEDRGRWLVYLRNDDAYWLDELTPVRNNGTVGATAPSADEFEDAA